jgi:hypothetical protein
VAKLNSDYLCVIVRRVAMLMRMPSIMPKTCDCVDALLPIDSPVLICGDFNLPNIDWSIDNCALCSDSTCDGVFLELYYNRGLQQFVSMPTRLDNILDLVFCNDYNCIFNPRTAEPFSTSDYNRVCLELPLVTSQRERTYTVHNSKNADWASIKDFLFDVDFINYTAIMILLRQLLRVV